MKISENQAILQLVALAREHKIQHVVLCPGSRNAAITHAFVAAGTFNCYSMVDERSAGFFALGIAQRTGTPVAVCVTSGTALLNLHPAVAEAFYQELPLVVISADRPRAWIGQLDGQTLPQPRVFGELVKFSADLPSITDAESRWHCNRLLNEAFLAATFRGNGPVHINVPLAEPLFNFTENAFPKPRVIRRSRGNFPLKNFKKRMLICGQNLPKNGVPALNFPGFVCLAEHLSNGRVAGTLDNFDAILANASDAEKRELAPDLLVTIGGHIVSKNLKKFLRAFPPREHWHISPDGKIADTFCCLTAALAGTPEEILADARELRGNVFCKLWREKSAAVPAKKPADLRERAVAELMKCAAGQNLYLANSSSVRLAQAFPCAARAVFCNRGTSGIEGTLSSALGGNAISGNGISRLENGDSNLGNGDNPVADSKISEKADFVSGDKIVADPKTLPATIVKTHGNGDNPVADLKICKKVDLASGDKIVADPKFSPITDVKAHGNGDNPVADSKVCKKVDLTSDDKIVAVPKTLPAISPELFLPSAKIEIFHGKNLQHWNADKKLQFVTFHLADSLPQEILQKFQAQKDEFCAKNPQPWSDSVLVDYYNLLGKKIEKYLEGGYGSCVLANKKCQETLAEVLFFYNEKRYRLHAFVVMPNHIHVLVEVFDEAKIGEIVKNWKGISANKINKILSARGTLWRGDYYDRVIRSEFHYQKVLEYIKNNRAPGARHWFATRGNGELAYGNDTPYLGNGDNPVAKNHGNDDNPVADSKISEKVDLTSDDKIVADPKFSPITDVKAHGNGDNPVADSKNLPNGKLKSGDKIVAVPKPFCGNAPLDIVLIGDLSFFYDMNSLAASTLNSRLRILLLNDAGGAIFRAAPGVPVDSPAGKFICATPRERLSAESWARSRGFEYFAVSRSRDLPAAMRVFADSAGKRPVFIEVLL